MCEINADIQISELESLQSSKAKQSRRHTFSQRKSILLLPPSQEDDFGNLSGVEKPEDGQIENIDPTLVKCAGDTFNIQSYIDNLREERKCWRKMLHKRKRRRQALFELFNNSQQTEDDVDLSKLSESERSFLSGAPNYQQIREKVEKLSDLAVETAILNKHIVHLHKRCISRAQQKLDDMSTSIIRMID